MKNIGELILHIIINIISDFNMTNTFHIEMIISDDFSEFGEVPWEPLFQSHAEGVYVFV